MPDVTPIPKGKKKPKTPRKTSLLRKCDGYFGLIVRSPGRCISCGGTDVIQCAHIFSRRYRSVRWDERNAVPLCRAEHLKYTVRPLEWDEWSREYLGEALYDELRALALTGPNPHMGETLTRLQARWDAIQKAAA